MLDKKQAHISCGRERDAWGRDLLSGVQWTFRVRRGNILRCAGQGLGCITGLGNKIGKMRVCRAVGRGQWSELDKEATARVYKTS